MKIKARYLAYLIIILCYTQYFFKGILNSSTIVSNFDDLFIVVFVFVVFLIKGQNADLRISKNIFYLFTLLFLILFGTSYALNNVPVAIGLLSFKSYFIYLIFFLSILELNKYVNVRKKLKNLVIGIFALQIVIIIPHVLIYKLSGIVLPDDGIVGTFGGANTLSYAVVFPLLYVSYQYIINNNNRYSFLFVCLALVLIIPRGDFSILYFLLSVALLLMPKLLKSKRIFRKTFLLLIILLPIITVFMLKRGHRGRSADKLFNPVKMYSWMIEEQASVHSGSTRPLFYPLTYLNLMTHTAYPLIGFGPGMYASYVANDLMPGTNNLVYNVFNQIEHGFDADVDSEFIPIWGEFGHLGLILFVVFFLYIILYSRRKFKKEKDPELKALAYTFYLGSVYMLVGFYINHLWEIQPIMLTYTIFVAFYYIKARENENITYQL